jgi:WD40 repeat protein
MICLSQFRKVVAILSIFFSRISRISRFILPSLIGLIAVGVSAQSNKSGTVKTAALSYRDVAPILKERCVVCHNHDMVSNTALSGGLALDSYAALKKGVAAPTGARLILTPGKSADSEIYKRLVTTSQSKLMPKGGPALPAAQIAVFKKWIDAGAPAGTGGAEVAVTQPGAESLPMPVDPAVLDVAVNTRIAPTPDLVTKTTPKDAPLELALKIGPLAPVTALAYSPDGKRLAVGSYRAVVLWDTATGQPAATIAPLAGPVQSIAFRSDGTQLAVAGGAPGVAGEVNVFDAKTLAPVGNPLTGHTDQVYSVAWSQDGTRLATASQDKTARLWEWPSGKELKAFKDHSDAVTRVCFSPDGKSIYTTCQDHNARRFDLSTGIASRVFSGHNEGITALAITANGKNIITAGSEPDLRWWNVDTGDVTARQGGHGSTVNDIVAAKDGKFIASASADHTVRLWDGGNGGQQRAYAGSDDWVYAVAISPDDKWVAGGGADGMVRLWETATGRLRLTLMLWPPAGKSNTPEWIAITPEGYYDGSPAWIARVRARLSGHSVTNAAVVAFTKTLRQPDSVLKSWQMAALDPAKLTVPTPPVKPTSAPTVPARSAQTPKTKTTK